VSNKTGEPIADVTADDPRGFSLGLGKAVLGSFGAHWFYQGETLGYRTLYVWFEREKPDDHASDQLAAGGGSGQAA
jgi:D-alanyl-D-alanine carboxypeptidase